MMDWLPVTDLLRPVQAFWECERNGQQSRIKIDVDLQQACATTQTLERWLDVIWFSVWAPLLNAGTQCTSYGVTAYLIGGVNIGIAPDFRFGSQPGTPLSLSASAVWNASGGIPGGRAQRRIYIAFLSANAVQDGQLTDASLARHQTAARSLFLGCTGDLDNSNPRLIVFRRARPANAHQPGETPAYLPLDQIVINTYIDKAPQLG